MSARPAKTKVEKTSEYLKDMDVTAQLLEAWHRADSDKATDNDVAQVRALLKRHPDRDHIVILGYSVEDALIKSCLSDKKGSRVVAENETENMRKRFDYENASGIERALIDRIVVCWLRVQRCEMERVMYDSPGHHRIVEIELVEKHLHMAHSRYLRAIEELAKVQFLMSRTNMSRLAAVRAAMKRADAPQQEPGKVLEMKAG